MKKTIYRINEFGTMYHSINSSARCCEPVTVEIPFEVYHDELGIGVTIDGRNYSLLYALKTVDEQPAIVWYDNSNKKTVILKQV